MVVFDFEDGQQGWIASVDENSVCGSIVTAPTHWSIATSLPGSTGIELVGSWWTNPNNGAAGVERSHVTSPTLFATSAFSNITFDSYTSNEGGYPTNYDVEHVQISINGGSYQDIHGQTPQLHTSCDQQFRTITFETTSGIIAGDELKYRFLLDTCDGCCGCETVTGWAFDNVKISGATTQPPPARRL
jgi:hypothetical protein